MYKYIHLEETLNVAFLILGGRRDNRHVFLLHPAFLGHQPRSVQDAESGLLLLQRSVEDVLAGADEGRVDRSKERTLNGTV